MPTTEHMKQRLRDRLVHIAEHPAMWGTDPGSHFHHSLRDLLFLDDRKFDLTSVLARYGKRGVVGPFRALFGENLYRTECVSVFAGLAVDLGYLHIATQPTAELSSEHFRSFDEVDATVEELTKACGDPQLDIGNDTLAYQTRDGWVYCDFVRIEAPRYEPNQGLVVPIAGVSLLRDVRLPTASFMDGLVLTQLGKALRWGADWHLRDTNSRTTQHPGVRAQLLDIFENDPSQRSDGRGPIPAWARNLR